MIDEQLRQLRNVLGAKNNSDLAVRLGLTRFSVSQWRIRGVIPPRYRFLIERDPAEAVAYAVQFIAHDRIYEHADNHYWLRAALEVLPAGYGQDLSAPERSRLLEFVLTRLMDAAADATVRHLGKPRCEGEQDYQALMEALLFGLELK